ncbi:enoyl-CoA hydratase/isomerase family protein [Puniceibacterium sp. IMCC21224]|uniref:enoyl-CoA hydratase/isomerase family protein n=1 Tax=Puniceibacterium sp. IMCC21224 TaxID=1618204 RepID=UPI00064DF861|nr:enoyl-CoA hydratase/isomerase family protein [Puniceibacterium sp. IMCC21224]KMK65130.1 enoyl-CoA hydratase/carnithine racemase [Puniceibacterium sp. IMCC21224]
MTQNGTIRLEVNGPRADVILARSEARNALNLPMCEDLIDAFAQIAATPGIGIVVLRSDGPVFCAGADMKERKGRDEAWVMMRRRTAFRAYETVGACAVPVIAQVQGALVGSGGEIAMSCDFIVASTAATFRFPEPQWGTVGATQRLQRVVGVSRAKELLYTGRVMEADEAQRIGLITTLTTPEALAQTVDETAERILHAPGLSLKLTKHCIDAGARTDLASGIAIELAAIDRMLSESDWRGSVDRFSAQVGSDTKEKKA